MANSFTLLRPFHLLLSTSFRSHHSFEQIINFVHEILCVKHNTLKKLSAQNIFTKKCNDKKYFTRIIWNRN